MTTQHCRRRQWHPTPVLWPGNSHGRRSLVGCSSWGREESGMTSLSLSCIGEGNGNPLQCSCLENPRDGEAWWAAIHGVAQSLTRLKRLSSSTQHCYIILFWALQSGDLVCLNIFSLFCKVISTFQFTF